MKTTLTEIAAHVRAINTLLARDEMVLVVETRAVTVAYGEPSWPFKDTGEVVAFSLEPKCYHQRHVVLNDL